MEVSRSDILIAQVGNAEFPGDTFVKYKLYKVDGINVPRATIVGIDPGKNFGAAFLGTRVASVIYGMFRGENWDDYRRAAREWALYVLDSVVLENVLIEGPSFGDPFGQVGLEGIRIALIEVFEQAKIPVAKIAPKSARKLVFGSGDVTGPQVWPILNKNAADALAIALAAGGISVKI